MLLLGYTSKLNHNNADYAGTALGQTPKPNFSISLVSPYGNEDQYVKYMQYLHISILVMIFGILLPVEKEPE